MLTTYVRCGYSRLMKPNKTDRINIKVTPDQKAAFEAAAEAEGLSLSAWIVRNLLLATKRHSLPQNERE